MAKAKLPVTPIWNALIRTHHIRSRKKVAALKAAAISHEVAVLLKSDGRAPGIMYVEALSEDNVNLLVEAVRSLHYLNYELVSPPAVAGERADAPSVEAGTLVEVETVKEFANKMQEKGIQSWWRTAMGYSHDD